MLQLHTRRFRELRVFNQLEKLLAGAMPDGSYRFRRKDGQPLPSFMGIGCLAEEAVVHEYFAVKIADHHSMKHACITGCGVLTGAGGAVFWWRYPRG